MKYLLPGRRKGPQPRVCRECHEPATHGEVEQRPAAVIKLDGTIRRFIEPVTVYWCADHTGIRR